MGPCDGGWNTHLVPIIGRQFDWGHTAMATTTAMPTPDTPQTALTRKMIAVAMHALPNSLGLRRSAQPHCGFVRACVRASVAE